jgi:cell division protein FtsB
MSSIQTVWGFIRQHKYFVVIAFFTIMVGFVDENSFWERHQRLQEINALKAEMNTYQNRYKQDTKALNELAQNPEAVVRVAREQYFMKYPNEDVFVFLDDAASDEKESSDNATTN